MNLNYSRSKNFELLSYIYSSLKISLLKYHFIKTKLSNLKEKKSLLAEKYFWRQQLRKTPPKFPNLSLAMNFHPFAKSDIF